MLLYILGIGFIVGLWQCRSAACARQQAVAGWRGESERMKSALADARHQLQETHASYGNTPLTA